MPRLRHRQRQTHSRCARMIPRGLLCLLLCLQFGCFCIQFHVDLTEAEMSPGHAPVVIDGRESSPEEWLDSVSDSFGEDGRAEFLWDKAGVYVRFSTDPSPQPWCGNLLLSLCSNSEECSPVGFLIDVGPTVSAIRFILKGKGVVQEGEGNLMFPPFDEKLVKFVAEPRTTFWMVPLPPLVFVGSHRSPGWSAELYVAWELLDPEGTQSRTPRAIVW